MSWSTAHLHPGSSLSFPRCVRKLYLLDSLVLLHVKALKRSGEWQRGLEHPPTPPRVAFPQVTGFLQVPAFTGQWSLCFQLPLGNSAQGSSSCQMVWLLGSGNTTSFPVPPVLSRFSLLFLIFGLSHHLRHLQWLLCFCLALIVAVDWLQTCCFWCRRQSPNKYSGKQIPCNIPCDSSVRTIWAVSRLMTHFHQNMLEYLLSFMVIPTFKRFSCHILYYGNCRCFCVKLCNPRII